MVSVVLAGLICSGTGVGLTCSRLSSSFFLLVVVRTPSSCDSDLLFLLEPERMVFGVREGLTK